MPDFPGEQDVQLDLPGPSVVLPLAQAWQAVAPPVALYSFCRHSLQPLITDGLPLVLPKRPGEQGTQLEDHAAPSTIEYVAAPHSVQFCLCVAPGWSLNVPRGQGLLPPLEQ